MKLTIDTSGKRFRVTHLPVPKVDATGKQRTDKSSGDPLWSTQVSAVDDSGGDIIGVNTRGGKPELRVHDEVEFVGLVAIPWANGGRNGIAYTAEEIYVLEDGDEP